MKLTDFVENGDDVLNESRRDSWRVVKLGEICKVVSGFPFPKKYQGKKNGKYLFIKVNDLNLAVNDKYIEFSENTIDEEDVKALGLKIYPPYVNFPKSWYGYIYQ